MAPFTLDREHRWLRPEDTKWSWAAARFSTDGDATEVPLAEKNRRPFAAEGVTVSLRPTRGASPEADGVALTPACGSSSGDIRSRSPKRFPARAATPTST